MPHLTVGALFLLSFAALAAPTPALDSAAPVICASTTSAGEWTPTQEDVLALEKALPSYFQRLRLKDSHLPAAGKRYARQYTGIIREGKKLVYARFYPTSDDLATKARSGQCWEVSDGGNQYWNVVFDPKSRSIVAFAVNGVA